MPNQNSTSLQDAPPGQRPYGPAANQDQPNQNPPTTIPFPSHQADLPPLPPAFQEVSDTAPQPIKTDAGSSAPPEVPQGGGKPIIQPKKKFGGGRIIATILGLVVLVGGVGAGIFLTQQKQLVEQQAQTVCDSSVKQCDMGQTQCQTNSSGANTGYNCTCVDLTDNANPCNYQWQCTTFDTNACPTTPAGATCGRSANNGTGANDTPTTNVVCSYCENDFSGTTCNGGALPSTASYDEGACRPSGSWCGTIQCDFFCASGPCGWVDVVDRSGCGTAVSTPNPTPTPSPSPTPAAPSCVNVKAYSSDWTAISETELPTLTAGTVVNFCVAGTAASGTFDKAQFMINGALQSEVSDHPRTGSATDFCQSYTILSTDTTVNVKAKIFHSTGVWVGESI